jgi:hypothetical protein
LAESRSTELGVHGNGAADTGGAGLRARQVGTGGDSIAETRQETRRQVVLTSRQPLETAVRRARHTSEHAAQLLQALSAVAQESLDITAQEEVARLVSVWTDIATLNRSDLLDSLGVAIDAMTSPPPNVHLAQRIRANVQKRTNESPAGKVVQGLVTCLGLSILLLLIGYLFTGDTVNWTIFGMDAQLLVLVAFAGALGSMVSVMRRIRDFTRFNSGSPLVMFLIGLFKPVIGVGFALFTFMVLKSNLISYTPAAGSESYFFAAVGFLAGFSEKLAPDIMDKAEGAMRTTAAVEQTQTTSRRVAATPKLPPDKLV